MNFVFNINRALRHFKKINGTVFLWAMYGQEQTGRQEWRCKHVVNPILYQNYYSFSLFCHHPHFFQRYGRMFSTCQKIEISHETEPISQGHTGKSALWSKNANDAACESSGILWWNIRHRASSLFNRPIYTNQHIKFCNLPSFQLSFKAAMAENNQVIYTNLLFIMHHIFLKFFLICRFT